MSVSPDASTQRRWHHNSYLEASSGLKQRVMTCWEGGDGKRISWLVMILLMGFSFQSVLPGQNGESLKIQSSIVFQPGIGILVQMAA